MASIFTKSLRFFYRDLIHNLICLSRGEDLKRQGIAYAYPDISPIFLLFKLRSVLILS